MDPVNYLRVLTTTPGSASTARFGYSLQNEPRLGPAVAEQIAAAKLKQNLTDYRQAKDQELFWKNPKDVFGASYKAAYWLAVAARTSQAWSLVDLAVQQQQLGAAGTPAAGGTLMTSMDQVKAYWGPVLKNWGIMDGDTSATDPKAMEAILKSAGAAILAAAPTNPGAMAAAKALGQLSDPDAIRIQQQADAEASASGIAAGTAGAIVDDAVSTSEALRSLFTGKVPRGWSLAEWDALKQKIYIAGGIAAVGTGVYLFGPAIRGASHYAGASMDVGAQRSAGRARLIRDLT